MHKKGGDGTAPSASVGSNADLPIVGGLTDDDVMLLLKLIFHRQETQDILKKLLEREKSETP